MTENYVKVALVQEPPVFLNLRKTLEKLEKLAKECAEENAKIIVFPETWASGYPIWLDDAPNAGLWDYPPAKRLYQYLSENSLEIPSVEFEKIQEIAKENAVYLVIGIHERSGGTLYNTTVYLEPDGNYKIHRKLTPTYTEKLVWGVGDGSTLNVLETPYGVLGRINLLGTLDAAGSCGNARQTRSYSHRTISDRPRTPSNRQPTIRF